MEKLLSRKMPLQMDTVRGKYAYNNFKQESQISFIRNFNM